MSNVKRAGVPIEVSGTFPQTGDQAKEFKLTNQSMEDVTLENFSGQRKILNIIPSIDTPTCATSTRTFNEKASGLDNTVVLIVAADLPMAMGRFCGAEGLEDVITLSTFRNYSFQQDYGVAIQSGALKGLCARAVVVLDENNKVIHSELVDDIKHQPDYDAALAALAAL